MLILGWFCGKGILKGFVSPPMVPKRRKTAWGDLQFTIKPFISALHANVNNKHYLLTWNKHSNKANTPNGYSLRIESKGGYGEKRQLWSLFYEMAGAPNRKIQPVVRSKVRNRGLCLRLLRLTCLIWGLLGYFISLSIKLLPGN